jgi:tetratricopeptide (TPR) repeat protein
MMKHLFHSISQDSSNIIIPYGENRKKMNKNTLLALLVIILASISIGCVKAQTTIEVSPAVTRPGDTVSISGQVTSNETVLIEISNSRTIVDTFNVTSDANGQFSTTYNVGQDAAIDVYLVKISAETDEASFIVSKMTPQQLTNTIKTLTENAKKQAETALIQARNQSITIPAEIQEMYRTGLTKLVESEKAIQNQNFVQAQESLQEALNMFRKVVEYTYGDKAVEPPTNTEQERNKVQDKLDQLRRQYNKIKRAIQMLREYGLNVQLLETDLNRLHQLILNTQESLDEGSLREADQKATRVQTMIRERLVALRQRQAEITKKLAERYQTALENRVDTAIDTFEKLQSVRPTQSTLALRELAALREKLTESYTSLSNGNTVEAIRTMKNTEYRLKQLAQTVNGPETARLLNRIDELTANLEWTIEKDTTQLQNEIEDTKETLRDYLRKRTQSPTGTNESTLLPNG